MNRALYISVQVYDGRYHGYGDWPPSPARLFQALVAGAAKGKRMDENKKKSFKWLESLEPPIISSPPVQIGQKLKQYVPDNGLDSVGGDIRKIGNIRTQKIIQPYIFNQEKPLIFIWNFKANKNEYQHAETMCEIALQLYQLGRGVDMAHAHAEIIERRNIDSRLIEFDNSIYQPDTNGNLTLLCPYRGSLDSLEERYITKPFRFELIGKRKSLQTIISKFPKTQFISVAYDGHSRCKLFEIRSADKSESFMPWPTNKTTVLTINVRDKSSNRLKIAIPSQSVVIDRIFIGQNSTNSDKSTRIRILPLPSIGHDHADHEIRRILVEVPSNCPMRIEDIEWAFSGLNEVDSDTGEIIWNLVATHDTKMLTHYGIYETQNSGSRVWQTVTPAALPVKHRFVGKQDKQRLFNKKNAILAVCQALRHIGVRTPIENILVQREPFSLNGIHARNFSDDRRFMANRLYHVKIVFTKNLRGPLVIGDGRYLGLGLMQPRPKVLNQQ